MKDYVVVEEFTTITHDDTKDDKGNVVPGIKTYHTKLEGREKETNDLCFEAEAEGADPKAVRKAGRLGLVHSLEVFWGVTEKPAETLVAAAPAA